VNETPRDIFGPAPRKDGRFHNLVQHAPHGSLDALRWFATRKPPKWPEQVLAAIGPKPVARVTDGIRATLIGHATVLLQVGGLNILTDPIWSERASPVSWSGPRRVRPPAIRFDDLPKIDFVLLSHSHYDHLDRPTLTALHRRDRPQVVTGLKVGRIVPSPHVTTELDWWQSHSLGENVTATYVPAQHFSARSPFDRNKTLWGGFVLQTPAGTIYFAADTGDGPHIAAIRECFGPMALSLLPIGAYLPRWFMAPVHMSPPEAVTAAETLQSRVSLPIHFDTFRLADDGYGEALRVLQETLAARRTAGIDLDFRVPEFGEAVVISR
jgi:L-ascorbate metabolism protein UlaG (beta-lactamase superfamily)